MVAPTHGPILRDRPRRYVNHYRELSTSSLAERIGNEERSLIIFYMSAYGSTARMAEAIRAGAEEQSGVRVSLYDLEGGETEPFVDLIEEADALAFGSPTINGDAVKPVWDLLSSLAVVNLKGKLGAAFGSYGWSGEAVRMIEDRMRGLKMRLPVAGLRIKLIPTEEELDACRDFGRRLSAALIGGEQGRVIDFAELG
jgi:flavorubredoxin